MECSKSNLGKNFRLAGEKIGWTCCGSSSEMDGIRALPRQ